jgi:tetratricopeptide (TPR) repeat protein
MIFVVFIFSQLDSALFYLDQGIYNNNLDALVKADSIFMKLSKDTKNCTLFYYLAETDYRILNCYLQTGSEEQALAVLDSGIKWAEESISLNRDYSDAHSILGALLGQRILIDKNPIAGMIYGPRSKKELERGIELDPENAYAHLRMGIRNLYTPASWGGGVEKSIICLLRAIELSPKTAEFFIWLGVAYEKNCDKNAAIKSFKKALKLKPRYKWAQMQLNNIID